jgi:putative ABC transport system substrate-binding protein
VAAHGARAQQAGKLPTVGYLDMSSRSTGAAATTAFVQRLGKLGWSDGRTVAIEFRWAEGSRERLAEIAAEFVRLKVDLIVTSGGAVPAVKRATTDIPIVFAIAGDPVGQGLTRHWRARAATSPGSHFRRRILLASGLNFCAPSSMVSVG